MAQRPVLSQLAGELLRLGATSTLTVSALLVVHLSEVVAI